MATDLLELSAAALAAGVARGEWCAEDCAVQSLARERACRGLNAVTWIDAERVLEAARDVDRRRARGARLGALAGVPVIVKDNIDLAGAPTAAATPALRAHVARAHAPVVARLLRADAVLFGKANMHELAGGTTSSNPATGIVHNPRDPARVPGGSSGGTAAALAARIVPAGLGSDTAGSVRIPSAFCGTAGLRPSTWERKLYSDAGVVPLARELDTIGPMARTVADVALLHGAITEASVPAPPQPRALRIGVPRRHYWEALEPGVASVAGGAMERLRAAGVTLVDVDAGAYFALATEVYMLLALRGIKEDLAAYLAEAAPGIATEEVIAHIASADVRALFERARAAPIAAAQVAKARAALRERIVPAYRELFRAAGIAAIAFPTTPMAAPPIRAGGDSPDDLIEIAGTPVNAALASIRNTLVTAALGAPGLSLPAGLTSQGLPVGLEVDALPGADDGLLALGLTLESALA